MGENKIIKRIFKVEVEDDDEDEFPKYRDNHIYLEAPSFGSNYNKFKSNTHNLYKENRIPYQNYLSNTVKLNHFYSPNNNFKKSEYYNNHTSCVSNNNNYNEENSFYNYNNENNYSMRTMNNMNAESPPQFINKYNYMYNLQDIKPIYLSEQKNKKNLIYSTSHKDNRYSTEGTQKYNKNSSINSQNKYKVSSIIYPGDEKLNTSESRDEQLIIYPEDINKYENEKYFDSKTSEGILKPKSLVVYTVKWIEEVYNDRRGRTKSCECLNSSRHTDENDLEIKVFKRKRNVSSDQSNDIKTIKNKFSIDTHGEKKKKPNIYEKKKISRFLDHFKKGRLYDDNIKTETNIEKGGIVYFNKKGSFRHQYNHNYKINKQNFNLVEYPKWKIVSSACLIQAWWRGLKSLYNEYLSKIIIIQKVYRSHYYKTKIFMSRLEEEKQNQNYNERKFKNSNDSFYGIKRQRPPTYISYARCNNYEKYPSPNEDFYEGENRNIKYIEKQKKSKYIYNKQNINYLKKETSHLINLLINY